MERVEEWLAQKTPDVLLMQETKLADEAAPTMPFSMAGYDLLHHGEGRWNGVAIASRVGVEGIVTNFGDGPVRRSPGADAVAEALEAEASEASADEARMVSAICGGVRVVSIYAPNGRALDTPFYRAKLAWFERLSRWLRETMAALRDWGLVDAYRLHHPESGKFSWWDYRAGNFHKGLGMRIDHLYVTRSVAERCTAAEIDRDARKGKLPSDHAPLYIDLTD